MQEKLTFNALLDKWSRFWTENNHKQIKNSSLVPDGDTSVLFTTAGMQPLVPYLLGRPHPNGTRLYNVQTCLRTDDIEEVGDSSHLTSFHMLGNWSLGDYFKEESIKYSFNFLTNPKWLNIPLEKLSVTVFKGDENAPYDEVSAAAWEKLGIPKSRIYPLGKKDNWWAAGDTGPCGPDTEIFYDTGKPSCGESCGPACNCGKHIEIWNNVFMEYNVPAPGAKPEKLPKQNVDTGMGADRVLCVLNGYETVFERTCFMGAIVILEELSSHFSYNPSKKDNNSEAVNKDFRIIADHLRSAVFLLGDEMPTTPSNTGRGYILRRLIRRAIMCARKLYITDSRQLTKVIEYYIRYYANLYPNMDMRASDIVGEFVKEADAFGKTLASGMKEFETVVSTIKSSSERSNLITGQQVFRLYDTFGFPPELTEELAKEKGLTVDMAGFKVAYAEHQEKSRAGGADMFKGGVFRGDGAQEEMLKKLHSATHLLHAALGKVLGNTSLQRGSNITAERLRFDFLCDHKLTDDEIKRVEELVNSWIKADEPIVCNEMSLDEAKRSGAIGIFSDKYGEKVTVYSMGGFSKELCGGPHASRTGELGSFKITKEEASSAGVRRIKAELR
ncbi:MAG: alanine--tRNA ligase [Firmicutes bacterium]|nr:alanine--tRNA ligase [Bacillota bacterium]